MIVTCVLDAKYFCSTGFYTQARAQEAVIPCCWDDSWEFWKKLWSTLKEVEIV
jgi:hypothetical protein